MEHLLRTPQGTAAYEQRSRLIEPVFGDRKHNRGIRSFRRRGLNAVRSEWAFIHLAGNILKLYQHRARPHRLTPDQADHHNTQAHPARRTAHRGTTPNPQHDHENAQHGQPHTRTTTSHAHPTQRFATACRGPARRHL